MISVVGSFNTTMVQMTEISQWPKCFRKKWQRCLSKKNSWQA